MNGKYLLLLFCFSAVVYGQSDEGWTDERLLAMKNMSESREADLKMAALSEIDDFLKGTPAGAERDRALEILASMVRDGLYSITYNRGRVQHPYSVARAGAAELLARYGGEESVRPLVEVLFYGNDPLVMGSAAIAVSQIDSNNKENIIIAFARILNQTRDVYYDEALAQDVLTALGILGKTHPEVFEWEDIMEGLNNCSRGTSGFGRNTRNMALELLRTASLNE